MSKKNNKGTKRRQHTFDLQREKELLQLQKVKQDKKEQSICARGGITKVKSKGFRLRKGAVIKGIKVTDSESKKKIKLLVKKSAAKAVQFGMDMDTKPVVVKKKKSTKPSGTKTKTKTKMNIDE
uniref:Uncharacterized protein n=1 Tax=Polytomella parva TaxID=51329 RepID=A0A7S0UIA3_9CHLO